MNNLWITTPFSTRLDRSQNLWYTPPMTTTTTNRKFIPDYISESGMPHYAIGFLQGAIGSLKDEVNHPLYPNDPVKQLDYIKKLIVGLSNDSNKIEHDLKYG